MFYTAWKMRLSAADCIYISGSASVDFTPPPHRGSAPILCWGLCPQTLHAHPTFELWLRYWRLAVRTLQRGRFVGDLGKTYSDVQEFKLGDREVRGCGGRKSPSVVQGQNL